MICCCEIVGIFLVVFAAVEDTIVGFRELHLCISDHCCRISGLRDGTDDDIFIHDLAFPLEHADLRNRLISFVTSLRLPSSKEPFDGGARCGC